MGDTKVSLKLLIDPKAKRVVFAEAGKDFVDFLFHLFSLPLSTVVKLLTTVGMVGSLSDLSKSIQALSSNYFQHNVTKQTVLQHVVLTSVEPPSLSLIGDTSMSQNNNNLYRCSSDGRGYFGCRKYVTRHSGTKCPHCWAVMSTLMTCVEPKSLPEATSSSSCSKCSVGGYVKGGVATYVVMDNLEVKPMSTICRICLLNSFNVKDVSSLVEKQVLVGFDEGIAILKASLDSQAVLTAVFKQAIETESTLEDQETNEHKNALQTYIKDMEIKLHGIYTEFITPLEKSLFLSLLREVDSWLLYVGHGETKRVYTAKLEELKKQGDPIEERYKEQMELGVAINQFYYCVSSFRDAATSNDPKFHHIDLSEIEKVLEVCAEAESWIKEKKKQQNALPKHLTPVLRSSDVIKKAEEIDRLCRPIMTTPRPALTKLRS